jgi:hypothetical protein
MGHYRDIAAVVGIGRASLLGELTVQLSGPVTLIGAIGIGAGLLLNDWRQRWLIAMGSLPMLGIGLLAEFWFSRYLLFTLPPLIVGAVCGWRSLAARAGRLRLPAEMGVLALCMGFMGYRSLLLIADPAAARWSPLDRFQYIDGWTSGYGYPEAARFLLDRSSAPSMIYSLDGHSAYQLLAYLPAQWHGRVKPVFYGQSGKALGTEEARLENLLSGGPAWIIISERLLQGYLESSFGAENAGHIRLRQIAAFDKPDSFDKPGPPNRLAIYEAMRQ